MTVAATTSRANHFLLAGTTTHGAYGVAVCRIRFLVRVHVIVPALAFLEIAEIELPVLLRLVEALAKSLQLLLL